MSAERKTVNRKQQLRKLLQKYPAGLSEEVLFRLLEPEGFPRCRRALGRTLGCMDDTYIARWVQSPTRLRHVPVWAVAHVPEDAPMPDKPPPSRDAFNKVIQRSTCNE